MFQIIMITATLDRDRDTGSGTTGAPHLLAAAIHVRRPGKGVHLATTLTRSSDGKSQRRDDGAKGVGSSGHDEETADGSNVLT